MKKTKNCIEPWRAFQFDATGKIIPCCSGTIRGDFGNININYFEAANNGHRPDIFENDEYCRLRASLLSGKLLNACKTCRTVHDEDISTTELHNRVINHLQNQGGYTEGIDLAKAYSFVECGGNITNRCNFSCICCSHSGTGGHTGYYRAEMATMRFLDFISFLCDKGLQIFNFCGIGELTVYPGWQDICEKIKMLHPQLRLRMISNFGKRLAESELDFLTKLDLIQVSCDTLDEKLYSKLRKGGSLPILLDNIRRLRSKFTGDPTKDPLLAFNVTMTDAVIDKLEGLFRFAAENSIFVHLSTLFEMEGSVAVKTQCVKKISELPKSQMPHIREVLYDLPRRMKAENPLTGVWEYNYLYKTVSRKADEFTFHKFVPEDSQEIYGLFYRGHQRNRHAYLRKLWLAFDDVIKGIYISSGNGIDLDIPNSTRKIGYRRNWCQLRPDGNLNVISGPVEYIHCASGLKISTDRCGKEYDGILFEILSSEPENIIANKEVIEILPHHHHASKLDARVAWESFVSDHTDCIIATLVKTQESIIIWCAGMKTLQMLSTTELAKANIKMIIDQNPAKKGQRIFNIKINLPEDIAGFTGKIIVMHASSPERVEIKIRQLGIMNEIILL